MNNESFLRLLRLNFDERNTRMIERLVQEKQIISDLVVMNSSSNSMLLHAVVKMELMESSDIIVETAFNVADTEYLISNYAQIRKICSSAFMERAAEIEEIFLQNVERESQYADMINPYMPLSDFEFLQLVELNKKVAEAYKEHFNRCSRNLTSVIENHLPVKKLSFKRNLIALTVVIMFCIVTID